jgi:hypothetical protein
MGFFTGFRVGHSLFQECSMAETVISGGFQKTFFVNYENPYLMVDCDDTGKNHAAMPPSGA